MQIETEFDKGNNRATETPEEAAAAAKDRLDELINILNDLKDTSVKTTIQTAIHLKEAKDRVQQYPVLWNAFKKRVKYHESDFTYYFTIAENPHLVKQSNWSYLPVGFSVLYVIAKLTENDTPAEFKRRAAGQKPQIHPKLTRDEANDLLAKAQGKPTKQERQKTAAETRAKRDRLRKEAEEADHLAAAEAIAAQQTEQLVSAANGEPGADNEQEPSADEIDAAGDSQDIEDDNDVRIMQAVMSAYAEHQLLRQIKQFLQKQGIQGVEVTITISKPA